MEGNYGFDITSLDRPTNQDFKVIFTPVSSVLSYKYRIKKNGVFGDYIEVNNNKKTDFLFDLTGIYEIEIITSNKSNKTETIKSGIYKIDKEKPVIEVDSIYHELVVGGNILLMEDVIATDNFDGNIKSKVTTNYDELDFTKAGLKELVYTVSDEAGNIATKTIYINVVSNNVASVYVIQATIMVFLIIIYYFIFRIRKISKLENRFKNYTIEPLNDTKKSIFDNFVSIYSKIIKRISLNLSKSHFLKKISLKYDKYVKIVNHTYTKGLDFISEKFIVIIILLLIGIVFKAVRGEMLTWIEFLIPIILGIVTSDLINFYKYRKYRNRLENDLLQAITVMNNAFKSGRSILQAIYLVTEELEGPIALEFKKMYMEINFGLNLETVFKRFSDRINLEEVTYLTVSLSILTKTGGNIIKVFSSIEKSLFNKKKLKLELKALTGSSRIIVIVLLLLPLFFGIIISMLNPTYFVPFFTTTIGVIAFILMLIIYLVYAYVVRRIIRIRM